MQVWMALIDFFQKKGNIMLQQPKLSVNRDFLGVQHVTETTHCGNVTKKRSFEVSYT